jgi:integrase
VGTVYRKTVTRKLPPGAEVFTRKSERFARWKDRRGKTRTAPITQGKDGNERISVESPFFIAKYRDGNGIVVEHSTGCRHEDAARRVLADLEREAELIRSGVKTAAESAAGRHQATPFATHLEAYLTYLESDGACPEHRAERRRQLNRIAEECGFNRLADLDRATLESWLAQQTRAGMSARTRNAYLAGALAFCNWCADKNVRRLTSNPFDGIAKANEKADPRRQRRAMAEEELTRLLAVARERPLLDALTVRKGKKKGERYANVRAEVRAQRELLGRERALIYKTLVLTGLRKGELASLTVGQLRLDDAVPSAILDAADEKNREGNTIALRADLAADLREWLADKLERIQAEARGRGEPILAKLPPDTPVFTVPDKLSKILNRDLRMAGIAKRDGRGRVLDVHALRHTFGTLLSRGGVAPRTAQAAMRHSKIDLTMSVYTDPRLLDVAGALDALPFLPLTGRSEEETIEATGTDGRTHDPQLGRTHDPQLSGVQHSVNLVAPTVAPTFDKPSKTLSFPGKTFTCEPAFKTSGPVAVSHCSDKKKDSLTNPVSESPGMGAIGLEPMTPSLSSWCSSQLS